MQKQHLQQQHWADQVVDNIIEWQKTHNITKLHVDDMKTPSGRVHVGALRGVVLHDVIAKVLQQKTGQTVTSTYVFNDMDNMDGLPQYLSQEIYRTHMGRSLHLIPAPELDKSGIDFTQASPETIQTYKQAESMAEFYAYDFIEAFRMLGCSQEIVWSHKLYQSGAFDTVIRQALDAVDSLREIYKEVADYELPPEWYPLQVICEQCGLTGSTLTTGWDGSVVSYHCQPAKVEWAKGCDYKGAVSPFGGTGKLLWKVDWPAHWKVLGVNIEGAGKDHSTDGGSRDMAVEICQRIYDIPNPFDIPYEWILVRGTKMSSSKGVGTPARQFVNTMPAEIGRFLFVSKHYNQVIDFDPHNTMAIPDLFDEYDTGARIYWQQETGDIRLARSFELAQIGAEVPQPQYLPRFRDVATWMQHPEIDLIKQCASIKGAALTTQELQELEKRKQYANMWVTQYAPDEFRLTPQAEVPQEASELSSEQRVFLKDLLLLIESRPSWQAEELQQQIFDLAKSGIGAKQAFQALYLAFLGKKAGPKAAWFLLAMKPEFREQRIKVLTQTM